jgi:excisionase family DNA binding protein
MGGDPVKEQATFDERECSCFHTVEEAARHLRLCQKQVRRLISRGDLRDYRFGTAIRIKKADIDSYAEAQQIRSVKVNYGVQ